MIDLPIFLQIPKTGGNTTISVMRANCAGHFYEAKLSEANDSMGGITIDSPCGEAAEIRDYLRAHGTSLSGIAAMVPYGIHRYISRPCAYFSLLREPFSRCISLWYFLIRIQAPEVNECSRDLRRLIDSRRNYSFHNEQVRMLTGSSEFQIDKAHFEYAKEIILTRMVHVGILEAYDDALLRIGRYFRWSNLGYVPLNVAPSKDPRDLPPGIMDKLREQNEWDIKLYRWLRERYLQSGAGPSAAEIVEHS